MHNASERNICIWRQPLTTELCQTNTRKMSLDVKTGIRHACTPVAVSQALRDQARFPRLLVYYLEKEQHDLATSTIRTM